MNIEEHNRQIKETDIPQDEQTSPVEQAKTE